MELMNSGDNYPVWTYLLKNSHLKAVNEVLESYLFEEKRTVGGTLRWKDGGFETTEEKEE